MPAIAAKLLLLQKKIGVTTRSKIHTTDILLLKTQTQTHTTDLLLKATQIKNHTIDIQIGEFVPSIKIIHNWLELNGEWLEI